MTTSLDNILSGGGDTAPSVDPTPASDTAAVDRTEPEGRSRDERGRFAAREQDGATPETAAADPAPEQPVAQPRAGTVPPAALVAERNKARDERARADALERQVQQLTAQMQAFVAGAGGPPKQAQPQPAPTPDMWDDPNAFVQHGVRQAVDPIRNQLLYNARLIAGSVHGKDVVDAAVQAFDGALASRAIDPLEYQRIMDHPNPFDAAVAWHKRQSVISEVGDDPAAYRERLKAEILAEIQAGGQQPQQQAGVVPQNMPSNLANARSASPRGGPAWSGPAPLRDIFSNARRKT